MIQKKKKWSSVFRYNKEHLDENEQAIWKLGQQYSH
jgi:hypothetical protein